MLVNLFSFFKETAIELILASANLILNCSIISPQIYNELSSTHFAINVYHTFEFYLAFDSVFPLLSPDCNFVMLAASINFIVDQIVFYGFLEKHANFSDNG